MYELWMPLDGKEARGKEVYTVKMSASGIFIISFLLRWAGLIVDMRYHCDGWRVKVTSIN